MYVAADCTRAYRKNKLELFTRQIVFLRPGTFIIFDRVCSTRPEFAKTWLLQAMKIPRRLVDRRVLVDNGRGQLFVQTLLPAGAQVKLVSGDELYRLDGAVHRPEHDVGPAPECRVEIMPPVPGREDLFLHVLTAVASSIERVPVAMVEQTNQQVSVQLGATRLLFHK